MHGNPNLWLSVVKEFEIVLTVVDLETSRWLKQRVNYPIKVIHDINLKYPCNKCNKKSCSLVKAYYGWKRQAIQTSFIPH